MGRTQANEPRLTGYTVGQLVVVPTYNGWSVLRCGPAAAGRFVGGSRVNWSDSEVVADLKDEATAHLIAESANLLEACEAMLSHRYEDQARGRELARTSIARAKGRDMVPQHIDMDAQQKPRQWVTFTYEREGEAVRIIDIRLHADEQTARGHANDAHLRSNGTFDVRSMPASVAFGARGLLESCEAMAKIINETQWGSRWPGRPHATMDAADYVIALANGVLPSAKPPLIRAESRVDVASAEYEALRDLARMAADGSSPTDELGQLARRALSLQST